MKILAIADRPPSKPIYEIMKDNPNIDLIVTLGDLDFMILRELKNITHIPKLGVYGNHCSMNYFEDLGIINMHLNTFEYGGYLFGGFEGCVRYKEDSNSALYTQEEATELMKDFPRVDILLCHAPPRGVNDEESISHQGFDAFSLYCQKNKPQYLFHGHTYPKKEELITKYYETEIIYVQGEKIIIIN